MHYILNDEVGLIVLLEQNQVLPSLTIYITLIIPQAYSTFFWSNKTIYIFIKKAKYQISSWKSRVRYVLILSVLVMYLLYCSFSSIKLFAVQKKKVLERIPYQMYMPKILRLKAVGTNLMAYTFVIQSFSGVWVLTQSQIVDNYHIHQLHEKIFR
jgi:hypothetical protein